MQASTPTRHRGFTLVETMVGLAVIGIASSLALPSFEGHVHRARRADALVAAMTVQAAQERFRSNAAAYGSLEEIGVPGVSPARHYTLLVTASDAEGFELRATATGAQWRDKACRYMTLRSTGLNLVHASGPDASVSNGAAANGRCWNL